MIKKIFSFIILSSFWANSLPAYSKITSLKVNGLEKTVISEEQEKQPKTIYCKANSTEEMCHVLEIKKTEVSLKSYLRKKSNAYSYEIKNNYKDSLKILDIKFYFTPEFQIKEVINDRKQFRLPQAPLFFIAGPLYGALSCLVVPFTPILYYLAGDDKKDVYKVLTAPVWLPVTGIATGTWFTMAAPYYAIKDRKEDKFARTETNKFLKEFSPQIIQKGEVFQFIALSYKLGVHPDVSYQKNGDKDTYVVSK